MAEICETSKLEEANRERALIYYDIFKELEKRLGKIEAIDVLRKALSKRGREFGKTLKKFSPDRFEGLYRAFAFAPDGGKMFSPKKLKCNNESLEIKFMSCPLKKAWQGIGLNNNELCTLLYCASALDEGTMAEAGFHLKIDPWKPGEEGCCRLKITKKQ